jgi:hypothetical protein
VPYITPLLRFLRCLTKTQRKQFAERCGTTEFYLYQIAAQPAPNPRLKLALAIVAESRKIAPVVMTYPLTLEDLLVGVPRDYDGNDGDDAPVPDASGD